MTVSSLWQLSGRVVVTKPSRDLFSVTRIATSCTLALGMRVVIFLQSYLADGLTAACVL